MNLNKNIVLIGMMGSGKSTIGYKLAKKLKMKFFDTDKIIEREAGKKIFKIFEEKGEFFFRGLEEKIVLKTLLNSRVVISLGGGGFLNEKIRKEVLLNNSSFWLKLNNNTLLKRLKRRRDRPILTNLKDFEIVRLAKERAKKYSKANYKINCDNLSKNEIIKKIINFYENE